ncbi:MAG TPA: 2-phospho-L-lactate guanylyltransferase [Ktedonosporobacter sp.]|nr:2-phospho-L-lactate guanylyltransferase [Ktedonosporobacter sp.]
MRYRALIPVKSLDQVKSRLADHLTRDERATLVLDMLHHVIQVLHESKVFEHITVVSADPRVLEKARIWGAWPQPEEQAGHNPALHAAALRELATGAEALLTISADLPLLQVSDIDGMIEQAQQYDVVLAPSREGTGTNALLVHPPLAIPYVFGVGSLQRYLVESRQRQLSSILHTATGLALDIDTVEDLDRLRQYEMEDKARYMSYLVWHVQ